MHYRTYSALNVYTRLWVRDRPGEAPASELLSESLSYIAAEEVLCGLLSFMFRVQELASGALGGAEEVGGVRFGDGVVAGGA